MLVTLGFTMEGIVNEELEVVEVESKVYVIDSRSPPTRQELITPPDKHENYAGIMITSLIPPATYEELEP